MQTRKTPSASMRSGRLRRAQPALLVVLALAALAARADDPPYVPTTYSNQISQVLPMDYEFHFPLMVSFDRDPLMPPPGPALPWGVLDGDFGLEYEGQWIPMYTPESEMPFGMQVHNGPNYPDPATTDYPAGVFLVEYNVMACPDPVLYPQFLNTPIPPAFAEAKDKADQFCVNECGVDFEMTDFDMNQWQYTCYVDAMVSKAYQVATWGGSKCAKVEDNGLLQPCNPLEGLVALRNHLGQPASAYPGGDLDGDGTLTLADLTRARNIAFGPKVRGIGESRMTVIMSVVEESPGIFRSLMAEETMSRLDEIVTNPALKSSASIFEITHWEPGVPVDCDDVGEQLAYLDEFTADTLTKPGKELANDYCSVTHGPGSMCADDAMTYGIGHCRINSDGSHSIRLVGGHCMKCI